MKRTFAIIAVLAAALALPAVAAADPDTESETGIAASVAVDSAIQLDLTGTSTFTDSVTEAELEGLATTAAESAIGFDRDVDVRSNSTWDVDLAVTALSGSNGDSLSLTATDASGSPNTDNTYQVADTSAAGGVDWADNAGSYTGTASITATNGY